MAEIGLILCDELYTFEAENILFEHSINNLSEEEIYIIEDAVPHNLTDNNLVIIRKS